MDTTTSCITRAHARFLFNEMDRLARERDTALKALASVRLESANRLAAIRAALGAARDGEADPLAYLAEHLADEEAGGGR
jgi:hypothetical protein